MGSGVYNRLIGAALWSDDTVGIDVGVLGLMGLMGLMELMRGLTMVVCMRDLLKSRFRFPCGRKRLG